MIIVDCIEFNEALRFLDPVSDAAFLVMDLMAKGHRQEAEQFTHMFLEESEDVDGSELLRFYVAYRATVRGKVEGMAASEQELSGNERAEALTEARGHWLLALGTLEDPSRRPGLVLVGGLPGVGKSTLARAIAGSFGFEVVRSDIVRKELVGLPPEASASVSFGEGIYTPEWTDRTYEACLRRADVLLFKGHRVIVDASFARQSDRHRFLDLARRRCVPGVFLLAEAPPEETLSRLAARSGDASDAGPAIYRAASERWEGETHRESVRIDTGRSIADSLVEVRLVLDRLGLGGDGGTTGSG
jgi:predicted kinase